MTHKSGLEFKKFDLHTHTPASSDFKDRKATAAEIVEAALAQGLTGIAITDHQTAKMVDEIKVEAKKKGLVIFPGVEIKVTGGERGIHVILLFDVDKDTNHVRQFLNRVGAFEKDGVATSTVVNKTLPEILAELQAYDPTAIASLAHCHSSQGVTSDMRGEQRSAVFEKKYTSLLGAEANESDFNNSERKKKSARVIDLFDGTNADYHKKRLGVYQSSDAHSLAEIGSSYTYFKVDEKPTIEDIRQCLVHRDSRIRQSFEYQEPFLPFISELEVNQGFLDEQRFRFHRGLNCILGGKGSGKSLTVEFLRFALNQPPLNLELALDHQSKLDKCLKSYGTVSVTVHASSGKSYRIRRELNPSSGNPTTITDLTDEQEMQFAVEEVFPVLFLSQNEIIKIAEDRTGGAMRGFIDKFFDFRKYYREMEKLNTELRTVDGAFAEAIRAHLSWKASEGTVASLTEQISNLDRLLQNEVFDRFKKSEDLGSEISRQLEFIDSIVCIAEESLMEATDSVAPVISDETNPLLRRVADKAKEAQKIVINELKALGKQLTKVRDGSDLIKAEWQIKFDEVKRAYEETIKGSGDKVSIVSERQAKHAQLEKERAESSRNQAKALKLKEIGEKRDQLLRRLEKVRKDYFDERSSKSAKFTELSNGSLRVSIEEAADRTSFRDNLSELKVGSFLRSDQIEAIAKKVQPAEFVTNILRYEYSRRTRKSLLEEIATKAGLDVEIIEKFADFILDRYKYEDLLELLYGSTPDDIPVIEYKVGAVFKQLDELSVGQKAISLLLIALSDGQFPIVIDQPEDSLDLRTIWNDVCSKIRDTKDVRQFILTTHNSSVAVASDTDKFTIVRADATKGEVLFSGSMNSPDIKSEVIDYLEGGEETYNLKKSSYNL